MPPPRRSSRHTQARRASGRHRRRVRRDDADLALLGAIGCEVPGRSAGLRTWHSRYLRRLLPLDAFVAVVAGIFGVLAQLDTGSWWIYAWALPLVVLVWIVILAACDAFEYRRLANANYQVRAVGRAAVTLVAVFSIVAYGTRAAPARSYLLVVVAVLLAGSVTARLVLSQWLCRERQLGRLMQRAVVVGRADSVAALIDSLRADPCQGLLPVAVCASQLDGPGDSASHIDDVPVLGGPEHAIDTVDLCDAEVVAVAAHPDLSGQSLRRLTWALENRGVELVVAPGLLDVAGPRLSIRPSAHLSLLHVERPAAVRVHVVVKSLLDRTAAALLLLALSPLLILVAIGIKLDDGGPVFFRQERVGAGGELFGMYKFRTMVVDAEARLASLLAASEGNQVLFKMRQDPRVTRIGQFLRRYSIDELPQLLNVLLGDMSLVGPRPPLPREVDQYEPDAMRRLRVKPGMTGLWQVSGRSNLSWEQSLRLDLHYVDNWSPIGDLHILIRTVNAVVRGPGAY